jgi:hypothetical protein
MLNPRKFALACVLIVLLALLPGGASFAKGIVQITISGPGLDEPLVLTDADHLAEFRDFGFGTLLDDAPAGLDDDYFELRLGIGDGSEVFATNVYHYIPGINADHGYLYFADVINGESSAEGRWFELGDAADRDLRHILRDAGVRFGVISSAERGDDNSN